MHLPDGRTILLRPLTVGDLCELDAAWTRGIHAMRAWAALPDAEQRLGALPRVLAEMLPCLARMSGLSAAELRALDAPTALQLLTAALEVTTRPFAPPPRSATRSPSPSAGRPRRARRCR